MSTFKYTYRLIAFVDILGFKDIIYRRDANEIFEILRTFQEEGLKETTFESGPKGREKFDFFPQDLILEKNKEDMEAAAKQDRHVSVFSDLIVISYSNHKEYFWWSIKELIDQLASLQDRLLSKGVLIRGGVTYGKLFHNGQICFGEGIIRAYELESREAIFPRIIIDKNISRFKLFQSLLEKSGGHFKLEWYNDGVQGISHFNGFRGIDKLLNLTTSSNGYWREDMEATPKFYVHMNLRRYKEIIDSGVTESKRAINLGKAEGERALVKFHWLSNQYLLVLNALKEVTEFNDKYGKLELEN
ncbi:hypothetical protein ACSX1A_14235 [Pontibacter sp. MBLB2868]|uniref:hypothetical protein n=1 Tax=Pontibacter sp. MBLB2868 TaxID=3451555 RepID=UPI003F74DB3E